MSGEISILGVVDRETYPSYNFRVRASDFGEPSPRSNLAQVELLVADVNDRLPVFEPEDVAGYLVYFIGGASAGSVANKIEAYFLIGRSIEVQGIIHSSSVILTWTTMSQRPSTRLSSA